MEWNLRQIGKLLILTGLIIALPGVMFIAAGRIGLFKLPGDFVFSGKNWRIYLPIATCIVISILLTFVIWLINYFRK